MNDFNNTNIFNKIIISFTIFIQIFLTILSILPYYLF